MRKKGVLWLIGWLCWCAGLAQSPLPHADPAKRISQFTHRVWTTRDGLPSNNIEALVYDQRHYLWIGTFDGLVRFDGLSFKTFSPSNEPAIRSSAIMSLAIDRQGVLWIGSQAGVVLLKDGHFTRNPALAPLDQLFIEAMHCDREGTLWIGTGSGLYVFREGQLAPIQALAGQPVSMVREDASGMLWAGTTKGQLFCKDSRHGAFRPLQMPPGTGDIQCVIRDPKGRVWVGTYSGVMLVEGGRCVRYGPMNDASIYDMQTDSAGNLWMCGNVLARLAPDGELERNTSVRFKINQVLLDSQGLVWMGTDNGGLQCLVDGLFRCFSAAEGMRASIARTICETEANTLWIGYEEGGIDELKDGEITPVSYVPANLGVKHLMRDSRGTVWISTYGGLYRKMGKRIERWREPDGVMPDHSVRLTFEDSKGNLWIGTRLSGLFCYTTRHTWEHYSGREGLASDYIMSLCEGPDGEMLIGSKSGFDVLKDGRVIRHVGMSEGLPGNVVFSIRSDGGKGCWLAVQGGICHYEQGELRVFTMANGLLDNACYDVLRARDYLWIPTSAGVMRIPEKGLATFRRLLPVLYASSDGMKDPECLGATFALADKAGTLWFLTNGGLASLHPDEAIPPHLPRAIYTEEVHFDTTTLPVSGQPVSIPAQTVRFTISFTAIDYQALEQLQFRYRLYPFEKDWVYLGSTRTVSFTNLSHGEYTFWLEASSDGIHWKAVDIPLLLIQQKPLYKRRWFQFVLALGLVALSVVFYHLRLRSIEARQRRLEEEVEARTEEIRNQAERIALQNDELRTLSNEKNYMMSIVAHDVRTPLNHIRGLVDVIFTDAANLTDLQRTFLTQIGKSAEKLGEMTSQILDIRSIESNTLHIELSEEDLVPVAMLCVEAFRKEAAEKQITLQFETEARSLLAWCNRDYLKLVLDNLLSNAIKFSPHGKTVTLRAGVHGAGAVLSVTDEGPGIRPEDMPKLFGRFQRLSAQPTGGEKSTGLGLSIVKKYVDTMKGQIRVETEPGKGATFVVTFSLSQPS